MNSETESDLLEYAERMQHIALRSEAVAKIETKFGSRLPLIVVTEIVYLQLRHMLEHMAQALLVVNRGTPRPYRAWHAIDVLTVVAKVNPDFYPSPSCQVRKNALTLGEFKTLYEICGEVLHTHNPITGKRARQAMHLRNAKDCRRMLKNARRWKARIDALLANHEIKVAAQGGAIYQVKSEVSGGRVLGVTVTSTDQRS